MRESRTPTAPAPRTFDPAAILRAAADGLRTEAITWGRDWFLDPDTGCRCALGAITWAADPDDTDGNPLLARPAVRSATTDASFLLADYLVDVQGASRLYDDEWSDGVTETVGTWNDAPGRTVGEVIAALEGAAA